MNDHVHHLLRLRFPSPNLNSMLQPVIGPVAWDRMEHGIEKVRRRLLRAASALRAAGVQYAVIGGNAVAAWVSR